ncbi:MAG: HdeD family acid-resistance protein [Candidatus Cryptobacteroides sp.]
MITFGFKNKFSGLLRAVAAIALGVVMVVNPHASLVLVVKIVAAFLIASGVVSAVYGIINRLRGAMGLMLTNAIVDIILGVILFIFPSEVASIILVILGIFLLVLGIFQIVVLGSTAGVLGTAFGFFVMPILCVLGGTLILFNPFGSQVMLTLVGGIALIVYGISELVASWRMNKAQKVYEAKFMGHQKEDRPQSDSIPGVKDVDYEKVDEQ